VLGDVGAAEDVLQEVFLQLWRNPQVFDSGRGSLAAWLAVIARNRAIDQRRRQRLTTDVDTVAVPVDSHLDEDVERVELVERVRAVLAALPVEQRSALEKAFFEGMTHSEIAQQTGEPLGTIKTRIRSALIAIRRALKQERKHVLGSNGECRGQN
jgi:RNA polymerase sigma-70 factor, ECF subfamily